jgi:hypothetical protein
MKYMSFSCERAFESLTGIIEQIFIKYRLKLLNKSGYHADVSQEGSGFAAHTRQHSPRLAPQ